MIYKYASQLFMGAAVAAFVGWVFTRFWGPIMGISQEGFHLLGTTCLLFVIAFSLVQIAFEKKGEAKY